MPPIRPTRTPERRRNPLTVTVGAAILASVTVLGTACGTGPASSAAPPPTASGSTPADAAFVLHMLPHHRRALEVGALATAQGSDPRVRAFGQRILAEQTPEEQRLAGWVTSLGLTPGPTDSAMAQGYIDDAAYRRLRPESGTAFDRDMLLLSADSETGAATMSRDELAAGTFAPARDLAASISTAPTGEIPELRALAARLR